MQEVTQTEVKIFMADAPPKDIFQDGTRWGSSELANQETASGGLAE